MFWETRLLEFFLNGLGIGAIFAFIALGYTMVYGIIKLINFAHGEFFMFGAFMGFFVLRDLGIERLGLPFPLPILIASLRRAHRGERVGAGVLAVVTGTHRLPAGAQGGPHRRAHHRGVRLAHPPEPRGQGVGRGAARLPDPRSEYVAVEDLPETLPELQPLGRRDVHDKGATDQAGARRRGEGKSGRHGRARGARSGRPRAVYRIGHDLERAQRGFVILALVFWTPILWFLVMRTRMGKAMRAVSEDADAARLMGININRVVAWTFFVGAFVAGVGGVAYCVVATARSSR